MLLKLLKTDKNARKIFGKKEIEIVEKQLNGVSLTQSEKNRLSQDIRKKLDFIKNISKFEEEFDLKKNIKNKNMIQKALKVILEDKFNKKIKAILLFGSFADNTFIKRSDIDICVVFKKPLSLRDATLFRIRVLGRLPDKFDIQVFNTLPHKIKRSIAKNHRILFSRSSFDNLDFSIRLLKDEDYNIRKKIIFET